MQIFKYMRDVIFMNDHVFKVIRLEVQADEDTFVKLLGNAPITRVLDFLLTAREFDYSKKEMAENSAVSYNTLSSLWSALLSNGIIVKTRRIGKQDMFRLNAENPFVNELIKFFDAILSASINQHAEKIRQIA